MYYCSYIAHASPKPRPFKTRGGVRQVCHRKLSVRLQKQVILEIMWNIALLEKRGK